MLLERLFCSAFGHATQVIRFHLSPVRAQSLQATLQCLAQQDPLPTGALERIPLGDARQKTAYSARRARIAPERRESPRAGRDPNHGASAMVANVCACKEKLALSAKTMQKSALETHGMHG